MGAILNTRFPVSLNDTTCTITETASSTNKPPMTASTISCLVATATVPISPPSASEPVSPMKIEAGAEHGAAQNCQLAGAGDIMNLQVIGEQGVAGQIRDQAEACGGDHDRHDG